MTNLTHKTYRFADGDFRFYVATFGSWADAALLSRRRANDAWRAEQLLQQGGAHRRLGYGASCFR